MAFKYYSKYFNCCKNMLTGNETWWLPATHDSVNKKIFRSSIVIGLFTLGVRFFTFFKEMLVARSFGIASELDAFLLALTIVGVPVGTILYSLQASFIPVFVNVRHDRNNAQRVLAATTIFSLLAVVGITILLFIFLPFIIKLFAYGFSEELRRVLQSYVILLFPLIFLSGLNLLSHGVLNAGKRFRLSSIVPSSTPLVTIGLLFFYNSTWGVRTLIWASVAGAAVEFILLQFALAHEGFRLVSFKQPISFSPDVKKIFTQTMVLVGGSLIMYGTTVVDQSMASTLDRGSIAALNYGNKVPALLYSLFTTSLATAALPYFSEMVAKNDWLGCLHTLKRYSQLCLVIFIPAILAFSIFSEEIVKLLFQRGAFNSDAVKLVAGIQRAYLLQVPSYVIGILAVRLISALGKNHLISIIGVSNFIINIILNWYFIKLFGVTGIALSTSAVYFVSMTIALYFANKLIIDRMQTSNGIS